MADLIETINSFAAPEDVSPLGLVACWVYFLARLAIYAYIVFIVMNRVYTLVCYGRSALPQPDPDLADPPWGADESGW